MVQVSLHPSERYRSAVKSTILQLVEFCLEGELYLDDREGDVTMAKKSRGGRMTAAKRRATKARGGRGLVSKRKVGRKIMKT